MNEVADLMQLPWIVKRALGVVDTLEIFHDAEHFETVLNAGVLNICERYPLSGEEQQFKRRDLRSGLHRGSAVTLDSGAVELRAAWDKPLAGKCTESFTLSRSDGGRTLTILTSMQLEDEHTPCAYNTVYRLAS
ncbi:hypothetical protein CYMTET_44195 [Cymbomonas tetramitiformis]|uniref:Uncharacterized protein n=1 Tax=Cymbomonas tetramitiformis TaxID=36881 RepID=A0AAE0C0S3_9CHLO|nr:hypothetical protein CYMTET_44195 [Cymbomonas tetramitiformis]